jgi:ankyrin repeat protein
MVALQNGHTETLALLLANGANVNASKQVKSITLFLMPFSSITSYTECGPILLWKLGWDYSRYDCFK